jgi:hypothetical protein
MSLRKQIIEDRIEESTKALSLADKDMAFLRLAHSIITGQSIHSFDQTDLVDGGFDKQIDTITIEEGGDEEATVYIIHAKNTEGFSSNALIQMHDGLQWIFAKPRDDLKSIRTRHFTTRSWPIAHFNRVIDPQISLKRRAGVSRARGRLISEWLVAQGFMSSSRQSGNSLRCRPARAIIPIWQLHRDGLGGRPQSRFTAEDCSPRKGRAGEQERTGFGFSLVTVTA